MPATFHLRTPFVRRFALAALAAATLAAPSAIPAQALDDGVYAGHMVEGFKMSPERAAELEKRVAEEPTDLFARATLIGYYVIGPLNGRPNAELLIEHVLWVVENRPESDLASEAHFTPVSAPEAWARARKAFETRLEAEPDNVAVLMNYAEFVGFFEQDLRADLMSRAAKLRPDDEEIRFKLQFTLGQGSGPEAERAREELRVRFEEEEPLSREESDRAFNLEWYRESEERAAKSDGGVSGPERLELAERAYVAGEFEEAAQHAKEAEEWLATGDGEPTGDYRRDRDAPTRADFHRWHTILGLLALQAGDLEGAKEHLRASAERLSLSRPTLVPTYAPLALARALLQAGERDLVLEHLEKMRAFLESRAKPMDDELFGPGAIELEDLAEWTARIQAGIGPSRNDDKWNEELR